MSVARTLHSRSGRSAYRLTEFLEEKPRMKSEILKIKRPVTYEESVSKWLWQSQDLAQKSLSTGFIQGIKTGKLDPNNYGSYTVQDAVYCYYAADDYRIMADKSSGHIKAFAEARYQSYVKYYTQMFENWHIAQPDGIALGKAGSDYKDYEHRVATTLNPLYTIVAMIPCNRLWYWLAEQLKKYATDNNLYSFWIEDNDDDHGAVRLEAFVDEHTQSLDSNTCLEVYRTCMEGEFKFFQSATPLLE